MRKQTFIYGRPDRYAAIDIAYLIEKRGFTWDELKVCRMLADSSKAIREFIIGYAKDTLDMWEGLKPCAGHDAYEIAFIAAHNAEEYAKSKISGANTHKLASLLVAPDPWDDEQKAKAFDDYYDRTKSRTPGKLVKQLEAMEDEALQEHASLMLELLQRFREADGEKQPPRPIEGENVVDFNKEKARRRG